MSAATLKEVPISSPLPLSPSSSSSSSNDSVQFLYTTPPASSSLASANPPPPTALQPRRKGKKVVLQLREDDGFLTKAVLATAEGKGEEVFLLLCHALAPKNRKTSALKSQEKNAGILLQEARKGFRMEAATMTAPTSPVPGPSTRDMSQQVPRALVLELMHQTATRTSLGSVPTASSSSRSEAVRAAYAAYLAETMDPFSYAVNAILNSSEAKAWNSQLVGKIRLLVVFNAWQYADYSDALDKLFLIYQKNQVVQMIENMDSLRETYHWDPRLTFVAFRKWLGEELQDILDVDMEDEMDARRLWEMKRRGRLVEGEEDNFVYTSPEDPFKQMISYLLQVLEVPLA